MRKPSLDWLHALDARTRLLLFLLSAAAVWQLAAPGALMAHGVASGDAGYIQESSGVLLMPFAYLGAKHMVTGYDHLLFLLGVIFFLYRLKDIGVYVSLFAIGHCTTLLLGVLTEVRVSAYLIDAIIGLSVVYKSLDNLGAFKRWFGVQPNTKAGDADLRLFSRIRPGDQDPGVRDLAGRADRQPDRVQRGRGDRATAGAEHHPDRHELLAPHRQLRQTRLRRQRGGDVRRIRADGLPAHGLLRLPDRIEDLMYNTEAPPGASSPRRAR